MPTKGICLKWSRGRLFSPSLSCRGQGIGKQHGTISSWHKRTAGRNLVVHRHGKTLRQSVQRYRCRLYFSLFFSHFDIKAGKSPEDIVGKEAWNCEQWSRRNFLARYLPSNFIGKDGVWAKSQIQFLTSLTGVLTGRKNKRDIFLPS